MSEKTTWTFADGRKLVFAETEPGTEFSGSPRPYILYADGTEGEATPLEVMVARLELRPATREEQREALERAMYYPWRAPQCGVCGATGDLQRSPMGWQCERCLLSEDLVETPDYEALGYPETTAWEMAPDAPCDMEVFANVWGAGVPWPVHGRMGFVVGISTPENDMAVEDKVDDKEKDS